MRHQPRIEIVYCTQCRWLLRAGWTAQELLTSFATELGEVALVPGGSGIFEEWVDDELSGRARSRDAFLNSKAEAAGTRPQRPTKRSGSLGPQSRSVNLIS